MNKTPTHTSTWLGPLDWALTAAEQQTIDIFEAKNCRTLFRTQNTKPLEDQQAAAVHLCRLWNKEGWIANDTNEETPRPNANQQTLAANQRTIAELRAALAGLLNVAELNLDDLDSRTVLEIRHATDLIERTK